MIDDTNFHNGGRGGDHQQGVNTLLLLLRSKFEMTWRPQKNDTTSGWWQTEYARARRKSQSSGCSLFFKCLCISFAAIAAASLLVATVLCICQNPMNNQKWTSSTTTTTTTNLLVDSILLDRTKCDNRYDYLKDSNNSSNDDDDHNIKRQEW